MKIPLMKTIKERLGVQVFVAVTALIFLVSVSFMLLLVRFQYTAMTSALEDNGRLMAEMLAFQSRIALFSENDTMLQVPVESPLQNPSVIEVSLYNIEGKIVARKMRTEGEAPAQEGELSSLDAVFKQLFWSSSALVVHDRDCLMVWQAVRLGDSFLGQEPVFSAGRPSAQEDDPIGYVKITMEKELLKKQLRYSIVNIVGLGLIFWLAAAFIAFLLVKQIQQPIRQLTEGVRRFGMEGGDENFPVDSKNEIGGLAKAFQEMAASLRQHVRREIETARELSHARNLVQLGVASSKVTHEVGNLLNNMGMVLPALKQEALTPIGEKRLMLLEKEAGRLQAFISDFLQFARKPMLQTRKGHLSWTIQEVLLTYQHLAEENQISLLLDWQDGLPPISADHRMLYQAINNLVSNSMAAVERNGVVRISGRMDGSNLVVTVEDSGPGMTPEVREKIFEPFFTTKGRQGTGLGLSIVQGVIQAHGGTIVCDSTSGQGTRFVIRLPAGEPHLDVAP